MEVRFHCARWAELPRLELYLDQVMLMLEEILAPMLPDGGCVSAAAINNCVKQKLLAPTVKKKYGRGHLADLVMLFLLKRVLSTAEQQPVLAELKQGRTPENAYDLFCAELEYHLSAGELPAPEGCPPLVRAALQALAGKLRFELLLAETATIAESDAPAPENAKPEQKRKAEKRAKGKNDGDETVENKGAKTL